MFNLGQAEVLELSQARLDKLTPDRRARWGKMSAPEMVCHLSDSFRFALNLKVASDASGVLQRTVVKWIALYVPVQWPKGVATTPEMKQGVGGTCPAEFERDKSELAKLMREFAGQEKFSVAHPIFGRMSLWEWQRWGYLHTDHHLRQFGL